jgi:hypothetical protein
MPHVRCEYRTHILSRTRGRAPRARRARASTTHSTLHTTQRDATNTPHVRYSMAHSRIPRHNTLHTRYAMPDCDSYTPGARHTARHTTQRDETATSHVQHGTRRHNTLHTRYAMPDSTATRIIHLRRQCVSRPPPPIDLVRPARVQTRCRERCEWKAIRVGLDGASTFRHSPTLAAVAPPASTALLPTDSHRELRAGRRQQHERETSVWSEDTLPGGRATSGGARRGGPEVRDLVRAHHGSRPLSARVLGWERGARLTPCQTSR